MATLAKLAIRSADELVAAAGDLDMSHFWMPFTNNRFFKANPRLFA